MGKGRGMGKERGMGKKGKGLEVGGVSLDKFEAMFRGRARKTLGLKLRKAGWWNVDSPYTACVLTVTLVSSGAPLADVAVYAVGRDYKGRSAGLTDAQGRVNILAQFGSAVRVEAQLVRAEVPCDDVGWAGPSKPPLPCVKLGNFRTGEAGSTLALGTLDVAEAAAAAAAAAA